MFYSISVEEAIDVQGNGTMGRRVPVRLSHRKLALVTASIPKMNCSPRITTAKAAIAAAWASAMSGRPGTFIAGSNGCPFNANGTSGLATVLLVDDDPNILRPLQLLVEREGYRVITAQDGRAALAAMAIESPGIIVTDWMMPDIDGIELCRRLKGDPATADIPVVMLSAALPPAPKEPLWDVLLRKPAPIAHLIAEIHNLLGRPHPDSPGRPSGY